MNKSISAFLHDFKKNGVICVPDFLGTNEIAAIKDEIHPWLNHVSSNGHLSSMIVGNNQWIEHLGLCSNAALQTILNKEFIDLAESYFNEEVVLGTFQFQKKILSEKNGLPLHMDKGKGIHFFIYLTEVTEATGTTVFLKGSHLKKPEEEIISRGVADELYLSSPLKNQECSELKAYGGAGSLVVWERGVWHELPGYSQPGRELIMASLIPKSAAEDSKNHLFSSLNLSKLNAKQLSVCVNDSVNKVSKSLMKLGEDSSAQDDYKISKLRMWVYYIRFKFLGILKTFVLRIFP
jgi:hypothetical protein